MKVQILGSGCAKCKNLEQKVRLLNDTHHLNLQIEKVTDLQEIIKYRILSTPGLVIDGTVKSSGSIPKDEQLLTWFKGTQS
jgi:small redox-active disulfide protein 2